MGERISFNPNNEARDELERRNAEPRKTEYVNPEVVEALQPERIQVIERVVKYMKDLYVSDPTEYARCLAHLTNIAHQGKDMFHRSHEPYGTNIDLQIDRYNLEPKEAQTVMGRLIDEKKEQADSEK